MYDRSPAEVPRTPYHLVPGTSRNWISYTSCGRPHLELLDIFFSCKKQEWISNTRTIASKKHFFHYIMNFCVGPLRSPEGSCRSGTLGPLGRLQGTSPGRRVLAGTLNLFVYVQIHLLYQQNHHKLF